MDSRNRRKPALPAELADLKAAIDEGIADVKAGRVKTFSVEAIAARGRRLLASGRAKAASRDLKR